MEGHISENIWAAQIGLFKYYYCGLLFFHVGCVEKRLGEKWVGGKVNNCDQNSQKTPKRVFLRDV